MPAEAGEEVKMKNWKKASAKFMAGAMALAMTVGGAYPLTAKAADNRLVVSKFDAAPVIDGKIDDGEWGDVAFTVQVGEDNIFARTSDGVTPTADDFKADIYLGYDSTHVYIAAVAEYAIHKNEALLPGDLWQGDCMQIQISDTVGDRRNELGFTFNSLTQKQQATAWASTGTFNMEGEKDYIVYREGTTTVYEIALGVEQFSNILTELEDGMTIPFSLAFHMSGGGFIEYCDGVVEHKDINLGALLGLGAEPDESAVPPVAADPNAVDVNDTLLDTRTEIGNRDVPGILEAEDYDELYGNEIHINEECPDGNGGNLGWTSDRDYIVFKNVNFNSVPAGVVLRTSGTGEPNVQIRLDAVDGTKIAELKLTASGDWNEYVDNATDLLTTDGVTGTHDVYVLINGGMNLNWIQFTEGEETEAPEESASAPEESESAPEESESKQESAPEATAQPTQVPAEESGSNTVVIVVVVVVVVAVVAAIAVVMMKKKKGSDK